MDNSDFRMDNSDSRMGNRPYSLMPRFLQSVMAVADLLLLLTGLTICINAVYLSTKLHSISTVMSLDHDPEVVMLIFGILVLVTSVVGHVTITSKNPVFYLQMLIMFLSVQLVLHVTCCYVSFSAISTLSSNSKIRIADFEKAVFSYEDNDSANLVDGIQKEFRCCGLTNSYKDWNQTSSFRCSDYNPSPRRCHVPDSCCMYTDWSAFPDDDGVTRLYLYSQQYVPPQTLPNGSTFSCGVGLLKYNISEEEVSQKIYTKGCLHVVKQEFRRILIFTGCIGASVVIILGISLMIAIVFYCGLDVSPDDETEYYPEMAMVAPY